jgi:hypothetical protein
MTAPKLFISYSWTTPSHEQWVLDLAERLRQDNIDVILDKWDLREGHDAYAFMERMVTDKEIKKVAIICDAAYVRKANERARGVGAETQIITGEIYGTTTQDKFVAVIAEKDDDGKPYLPAYYTGRIHIDLADLDRHEEQYERLVRWVFDKPLYVKPPLGKTPAFLEAATAVTIGNRSSMKRTLDQLRDGEPTAAAALDDYLSSVAEGVEQLRILKVPGIEFDQQVIDSIDAFSPTRDELLGVVRTISRYQPTDENLTKVHRFFEKLLRYHGPLSNVSSWSSDDFDNFVFLTYELFVHTIAILLDGDRFEQAAMLMETDFYIERNVSSGGEPMASATTLDRDLESLERRNHRLGLKRVSLRADLLHERTKTMPVRFELLAQADLVLFLHFRRRGLHWWPYTSLYLGSGRTPLPLFARANSTRFFEKMRVLFGVDTGTQLRDFLQQLEANDDLPRWGHRRLPIQWLSAAESLATKP